MLTMRIVSSPVGLLHLFATEDALTGVSFEDHRGKRPTAAPAEASHPILDAAEAELAEFFAGKRRAFSVPLAPHGTPFQLSVWSLLRAIPYGETQSYTELAAALGTPQARRAVGAANGRNPLSIVVPCHRVIGARGALTGYAGGLSRKKWLLARESACSASSA